MPLHCVNDYVMQNSTDTALPIVVIGGGIAGVSCAQYLALLCPQTNILLISASNVIKLVDNVRSIGHNIEQFDVTETSNDYLQQKHPNIKVITDKLIQLNAEHNELTLESGNCVKYHKLCVCCGAKPKLFDDHLDDDIKQFVYCIRDTETVQTFQKQLCSAKRVVLVGNGGIATEMVYEIQNCGVVWVVKDHSFGACFFDTGAEKFFKDCIYNKTDQNNETTVSKRLKYTVSGEMSADSKTEFGTALGPDWANGRYLSGCDDKHVSIEYNCEVKNIYRKLESIPDSLKQSMDKNETDTNWSIYVELTNSKIYGCDLLLSATGVVPNTELLIKNNRFKTDNEGALIINNEMLTSEPNIYAAGDVCSVGWDVSQHWFQMRLWTQARTMGVYAAHCIAAHLNNSNPSLYFNFEIFTHVTRFFGYKVVLLGLFNGQKLDNDYEVLVRITPKLEYVKVILKNGKMCGAVLIGETDLEETFENLILNQIDLSTYGDDLLNSTIDIDDYFD